MSGGIGKLRSDTSCATIKGGGTEPCLPLATIIVGSNPVSQLGELASWSGGTPTWVQVVWRMLTGLPFHLPLTLHQGSADPESGRGEQLKSC